MKEMSQRVVERKMRGNNLNGQSGEKIELFPYNDYPLPKGASVSVDKFDEVKGGDRILSIMLRPPTL
jgi:hypothetical protein